MKKTITTFLVAGAFALQLNAQVVLHEPFNTPFNPVAAGWDVQNLSAPVGTASWFQGTNAFNALVGGPTDYFAVNFNSTANTGAANTISNWLITPTLNLVNGAIVQFATRTTGNTNFADRLQLYYSTAGIGTNVGSTAGTATNTAGTFTNIMVDINSNQAAMGYPGFWVVITTTISGISTPTVGRLAFRYYLTNAGAAGTTGNFIGIDEFRYSMPCVHAPAVAAWNNQLCAGNQVNLAVVGTTNAITSYTWFSGANTNSISFFPQNPGMNSCYVLMETTPGCVDLEVANLNVLPSPTVAFSRVPNGHMCSGTSVTLTASGANSYTYVLSPTLSSTLNPIAVNVPTVNTLSTVAFVLRGRGANNCVQTQTVQLVIDPNPTVTVTGPTAALCIGKTATLGATGAFTYTWSGTASSTMTPLTYTTSAPAGTKNFTVIGRSVEGCESAQAVVTLTVNTCTGIEDRTEGEAANAYPNPFSDRLFVENFSGTIKLYNELGQQVADLQHDHTGLIDTTKLPKGIYLLQLTNAEGHNTYKKIIKH